MKPVVRQLQGEMLPCALIHWRVRRTVSVPDPRGCFFKGIEQEWTESIQSGLSSGEGSIWAVRNAIYKREKVSNGRKPPVTMENVCVDEGMTKPKSERLRRTVG